MIDFHYWPTPNGWKVAIMLEEVGLPYRMIPVDIQRGEQHTAAFLAISPNGRMPAIVDHDAPDGPLSIFESGAILLHLAERAGRFMTTGARERTALMEWLFWQVGNLGPMAGQLSHFVNYAQGAHPYSHNRYAGEYRRCLAVLERRLDGRTYIFGDYSIADMASWPWVLIAKPLGQSLDDFPYVTRWRAAIKARPAVRRGVDLGRSCDARSHRRTSSVASFSTKGSNRVRFDLSSFAAVQSGPPAFWAHLSMFERPAIRSGLLDRDACPHSRSIYRRRLIERR